MAILVIRSSVANLGLLPSNHRSSSRNAKSIPIAKLLKLVSNSVVLILASNDLVFVLQTPNAELSNIALSVCVLKDSLEILKSSVSKLVVDPIPTVLRPRLALTVSVRIHAFSKRVVRMLFVV